MATGRQPQVLSGCWLEASVPPYMGLQRTAHNMATRASDPRKRERDVDRYRHIKTEATIPFIS